MQKAEKARLFQQAIDDYYDPLYRFAFSMSKNQADAADLVQQTFYIWAKKGDSLRDVTKLKSWLFTTLYREFLRLHRRGQHQVEMEPDAIEMELPFEETDMPVKIDADAAMEALQELEQVYRGAMTLFYIKGMSYKEIAEILDLPIGTVMSRLSRGKARLKGILESRENGNKNAVRSFSE